MRQEIINALEELKTLSMTKKDKPSFLSIEPYECKLNNGKTIKRERLLKNGLDGSAVVVYPVTKEGKIIIAVEPRVFSSRTVDIGFPAGYIDKDEKPVDAAKRELREETGYTSDNLISLGSFYQDQGCSAAYNHYFLALDCKKVANQNLDDGEFIKYFIVDSEELDELFETGYITGLNTAYAKEAGKKYIRRKKMKFNVEKVTNEIIDFIREYYRKNNLKGAVIGISGGKDSGVVAGLFAKALGPENVTGIWMPCHSKEEDKQDAIKVANHFGIELLEHDLTDDYDRYVEQIKRRNNVTDNNLVDANINIKPRMRMATLYYHAAMLSTLKDGVYIVPGTSNKCENFVGYFTKGGDNVSDIQVLADLTVDEVIKVGEFIGVPDSIVHKVPDDGLSGKTDEEKLGVSYSDIAKVMAGEPVDEEVKAKVLSLHRRNAHKFNIPTYRKDGE